MQACSTSYIQCSGSELHYLMWNIYLKEKASKEFYIALVLELHLKPANGVHGTD